MSRDVCEWSDYPTGFESYIRPCDQMGDKSVCT